MALLLWHIMKCSIHHVMEAGVATVHITYHSFGIVNGRADWHTWLILKDGTGMLIGTHC